MKIKSAKSFRIWFKTEHKKKKINDPSYDENFIGTYYDTENGDRINGFYELYHGDKPNIPNDLMDGLKNAQDNQAVYEFVQNAVDCNSSYFAIYYNDEYLLAINNGEVFTINDLRAILNANQSTKTNNEGQAIDCTKIGRFGIGFKLVHRLVGENDGKDELVKDYKGPILFSWQKLEQFKELINLESIDDIEYIDNVKSELPIFFKILLTNFPTQPNEEVKDINYNKECLFTEDEFYEFKNYVKDICDQFLDVSQLNQGSIVFIKLGKGKSKLIEHNLTSLDKGVSCSLNFLNNLDKVQLGANKTIEKLPLKLISFDIQPNEIKNSEDEFCPINIKFGYLPDYKDGITHLKNAPNFYKYFPLSRENHGLNFVIHSSTFRIKTDRTQFEEDIDGTNTSIFEAFWNYFYDKLNKIKSENRNEFLQIYSNLLISKPLLDDNGKEKWFYASFYKPLVNYLKNNIPVKNRFSDNAQNVKINKLNPKLNLDLSNFGLGDIQWFEWDKDEEKLLIDEAIKSEKLGIKEWDIRDIIENADLNSINNWIANRDENTYELFLQELEKSSLRLITKEKLCIVKLFKFDDGNFYSVHDITGYIINRFDGNYGNYGNYRFSKINARKPFYFFHIKKTEGIKNIIRELGIIGCDFKYSKYLRPFFSEKVYDYEQLQPEKIIYDDISEKCKTNTLSAIEKKKLFLNFINKETKFDNVAEGTLKDLYLFCDSNSEIKPLNRLIAFELTTASWLNHYKIKGEEHKLFTNGELNPYLVSEAEDVFKEIYQQNQDDIIAEITTAEEIKSLIKLYQGNQKSFFKEFIIRKDNNEFIIDEKTSETFQIRPSNKETRQFIKDNLENTLIALPFEFDEEFRDEVGIVKGEELYELILENIEVDDFKEQLVDIIRYDEPKRKFLKKLSEFRFNSDTEYTKEHYEYKILDLACSELKENDFQNFKDKVVIETENQDLKLSGIPPFTDKIKIDDYEISLAKILPDNYENSDHLSSLINQFIGLGLNKERIGNLFGISEEPEPSDIFQIFSEQIETLENAEQLAFIVLYNYYEEGVNFKSFKVLAKNGEEYDLTYDFYTKSFAFISDDAILDAKYKGIKKILKEFPLSLNEEKQILEEPYFKENKFICPYIKDDLSDEEKLSLVNFLHNQWDKKNKKTAIKNIDWSKIDDIETVKILGFNPTTSVYPSEYACESEVLPEYLIEWIENDENKIAFLTDLGVWTENSLIVELRKFLRGEINDFHNNSITQEKRFYEDETSLFNSFKWLKEREIILQSEEQFEIFKKVVDFINENRTNNGDLKIDEKNNIEELEENSIEWEESYYETWKEGSDIAIFLYEGELPKTISLYEIEDYEFYSFNKGNIAIDDDNNIYINQNADVKKELRKLELENDDFDFDGLWQNKLEASEKRIEALERENELLKEGKEGSIDENSELSFDFKSELDYLNLDNNLILKLKRKAIDLGGNLSDKLQFQYNILAKISLLKHLRKEEQIDEFDLDKYNELEIEGELYLVYSSISEFAHIQPTALLLLKESKCKIAVYYGTNIGIKIYKNLESLFELNHSHIFEYQTKGDITKLLEFLEKNNIESYRYLMVNPYMIKSYVSLNNKDVEIDKEASKLI